MKRFIQLMIGIHAYLIIYLLLLMGNGYWVKDGYKSKDEVFSTEQKDATHVVWYMK